MPWQDKIRDADCTLCPLHKSAGHVCLMGSGPRKAKVMIVGEAPGEREDDSHQAFVGRSGQLLRDVLRRVGLDPDEVFITNVAKCRPPENRAPTKAEAKTCAASYLKRELAAVDPDFVLALGNTPLQALVGRSGITKYRGALYGNVFPTFHPAYVLRSPQFEPQFVSDLERFARLARGEAEPTQARSKLKIIKSESQLDWLKKELATKEVVAFDFETSDRGPGYKKDERYFAPWDPPVEGRQAAMVCASFAWEEGASVVLPLWHVESPWMDRWREVWTGFRGVLCRDHLKLVAHNGKFDCKWAWHFGVPLRMTFDTMLAAHILDENRLKGLKPLSEQLLGASAYGIELIDSHLMSLTKLSRYAGKDTDYTLRLYHIFKAQLQSEPRLRRIFARLMMPASHELTKIELGGMYVDPKHLDEQMRRVTRDKRRAAKKLQEFIPQDVVYQRKQDPGVLNLNSPQQLGQWLFRDLKLPILETTKTDAPSTAESTLLRLAKRHPGPALLLEYRKHKGNLEKLVAWERARDARGRIHTNYKLFGTVTGRLSSEDPNLQQVPREGPMRQCFGSPPGWSLVEADYSQVELRIAAMLSRDGTLLRIFATGGDPHLSTAAQVSGLTPQEILDSDKTGKTEHRKKAKAVNFGFLYGMGEKKFVEYARDNYGVDVTPSEAKVARDGFFELYSRLVPWHDRQRRLVGRHGRVHSPIGRVRHLPTVWSSDRSVVADAERQAINSPVQSMASDCMLLSLVRLADHLSPLRARVVGTVHDSLLFEIRDGYVDEAVKIIRHTMETEMMELMEKWFDVQFTVPIEVEIKVGQHWGAGAVVE
jgi:uracil-DNA glycosylase family 4